jgi:hypothetical protein
MAVHDISDGTLNDYIEFDFSMVVALNLGKISSGLGQIEQAVVFGGKLQVGEHARIVAKLRFTFQESTVPITNCDPLESPMRGYGLRKCAGAGSQRASAAVRGLL